MAYVWAVTSLLRPPWHLLPKESFLITVVDLLQHIGPTADEHQLLVLLCCYHAFQLFLFISMVIDSFAFVPDVVPGTQKSRKSQRRVTVKLRDSRHLNAAKEAVILLAHSVNGV